MPELKELQDQIQNVLTEMRTKNNEVLEEVKKTGIQQREEDKATLQKMNDALDETKKRLDETELKLERSQLPGNGNQSADEKKAAHLKAFCNYMRQDPSRGIFLSPEDQKALVEDSTGQILVPEEVDAEITRTLPTLTVMRNLAQVRSTKSDRVRRISMTEVSMGWGKLETGSTPTESTPTPSEAYMYVEDLSGLVKLGRDELQDSDTNLISYLSDSFGRARAETEDTGFTTGTGHTYQQPEGLAVNASIIASYKTNWTTADTVLVDDMLTCEYSLPAQYLKGASWLMHRNTELALRLLRHGGSTTGDGPYMWQPGLQAGQPNNFDGFPIYNQADMNYPSDATAGINVLFGNFKVGYRVLDHGGMSIQRLNELYAESGLVGFMAYFRVGGGVLIPSAFYGIYNNT